MTTRTMLGFLFFVVLFSGAFASAFLLFEGKDSDASEAGLYTLLAAGTCVWVRSDLSEDDE